MPELENPLLRYRLHVAFAALGEVLEYETAISMSRQAPAALLVDHGNVTVFAVGGGQLAQEVRKGGKRRATADDPSE